MKDGMKEVLQPLALVPGVRMAAMISPDGVPIAVIKANSAPAPSKPEEGDAPASLDNDDALNAFTALAAALLGDITRSVGQLAWNPPHRVVMRGSQGALVMLQGPGAVLLTVLEHGTTPEEVRVPMEGAVARMQRKLRSLGSSPDANPVWNYVGQAPKYYYPAQNEEAQPSADA